MIALKNWEISFKKYLGHQELLKNKKLCHHGIAMAFYQLPWALGQCVLLTHATYANTFSYYSKLCGWDREEKEGKRGVAWGGKAKEQERAKKQLELSYDIGRIS